MPPKPRFTKEEMVNAALLTVSKNGPQALTARELGKSLSSSARPIFTVFKNMDELRAEVKKAAMLRFEDFCKDEFKDMPEFKRVGMKMVMFAAHEPKLFSLLFMSENKNAVSFDDVFSELGTEAGTCIDAVCRDYNMTMTSAKRVFESVWIYTFGVCVLCATGACRFKEDELSRMLSDEFSAVAAFVKNEESAREK